MRRMWKQTLLVAALGLTAGGAVGCAEERPPINKVQPNALAKSFFVGANLADRSDDPEFWTQGTLVDVGYGAGQDGLFTSTYAQPLSRIKWVIQEDLLVGRITYERLEGSDGKGAGKATDDGIIAVVYPILSHFDIRRDYNPTTGEESNIIVENTTDRPWHEREYMRVDWSRNLNVDGYDFDTLSLMGVYGGVTYESLSYYINDPHHEDAPHFDAESGYFDVTNKAFATPALVAIPPEWGGGYFPACYLDADFSGGSAPAGNCNPVELTIRQSFRRVVDKDFEPQDWDGFRFQAFGAFTIDRNGYARNYGMSDDKWHRFISRYNIWDRSHVYQDAANMRGPTECFVPATTPPGLDPHRDDNQNGTDDECESVGRGSKCDTFKQRCTLPYRDRTPVPQAWYYSKGSNQEFFDGTDWAAHEWDVAIRSAVVAARYAECKRTGEADCSMYPMTTGQQDDNEDMTTLATEVDACRHGLAYSGENCDAVADRIAGERGYSAGVVAVAKMPEMIVLCHSPVQADDADACGTQRLPSGTTAAECDAEYDREALTADGDPALLATCRAALNVRMGDLRYHQVNVMKAPQTPSPWGIYTDAEDPLTGEKVAASINVWSHVNDLWSQGIVDTVRYIKGELTTAEVSDGQYVRNWVNADKISSGGSIMAPLSKAEVTKRIGSVGGVEAKNFEDQAKTPSVGSVPMAEIKAKVSRINQEMRAVKADIMAPTTTRQVYEARRTAAIGSKMEAALVTPAMQELTGTSGMPMSESVIKMASPLQGANPTLQRDFRLFKELALANRGACIMQEAPSPTSMTGLADVLEAKFGAFNPGSTDEGAQLAHGEAMRRFLAQRAQYAVIVHEMGHSIGMRHNFVSSSDAWNYRPQYWQLRTKNGTIKDECLTANEDANGNGVLDPANGVQPAEDLNGNGILDNNGEHCVGPRYFDPMTEEERSQLIWMFMQSSVMDYAGENTQDMIGLGAYDFAAARMFYGESIAVHADPSYNVDKDRGKGVLNKVDSFGGLLGFAPGIGPLGEFGNLTDEFHYAQYQNKLDLLAKNSDGSLQCTEVNPEQYRPAAWNDARDGTWNALLDGRFVSVDGVVKKCKQQPVDYVPWTSLRYPSSDELKGTPDGREMFYRGGPSVDTSFRTRVPYGFATDRWADTGNLAVYRHDNGADPYELFNFLIASQEVGHIFDAYRRNRQSFSLRNYASRNLGRYNEKMRDGAKGLSLLYNIYREYSASGAFLNNGAGVDFDVAWPAFIAGFFKENIIASGMAFDHFTRQMARPHIGPHYEAEGGAFFSSNGPDPVLRAGLDSYTGSEDANDPSTILVIPNGATGYHKAVGIGGKSLNNELADNKGEYDSEYWVQAGCYYEKAYATMLMTESVDNFISDSRQDFLDSRYRAVSLADLFKDGYRRWLGNNLTGDDFIKGPRVIADGNDMPVLDVNSADETSGAKKFPAEPIGWTQWWNVDGPEVCFPRDDSTVCSSLDATTGGFDPLDPTTFNTRAIDPQVGWEQQKFLIAWTMMYLPENQQQEWLDLMNIWEVGADTDPVFDSRLEFHSPFGGEIYVARTFGMESIFGKTVQKGIGARILEWANQLLAAAYVVTDGPDLNGDGTPDWYIPALQADGTYHVKWDPGMWTCGTANCSGNGAPGCNATENFACTCTSNHACLALKQYVEVPFYVRQAMHAYGLADPSMKGLYP